MSRGNMRGYVLENETNKNDGCTSREAEQYDGHRQTEAGVYMHRTRSMLKG